MLSKGIYEQVLNEKLDAELLANSQILSTKKSIDSAEAAQILSRYLSEVIENALEDVLETAHVRTIGSKIEHQVDLANKVIELLAREVPGRTQNDLSIVRDSTANLLTAVLERAQSFSDTEIVRPETSIARSSLFTGAVHEPSMYTELKKEILSANRVDMLVSFIKWSGIRLIMDDLRAFTQSGKSLRIITTSYMGATDVKAIEELRQLPNTSIQISYDTKRTRLHAKSYVFYRDSGFTTAYVGSSNLSNVAISSGLEWNVKVTAKDLPETLQKIEATFESYWNSSEFEPYTADKKGRLESAIQAERKHDIIDPQKYFFDIRPYPYQQEILDQLEAERQVRGKFRNLIVAATGTGKTVIAALDYKRFCQSRPSSANRLLFVAHREEILKQSLYTFRGVLRDANFGDLFVGNNRPEQINHLFISVQTFTSQEFHQNVDQDFYDFIVIDETHHAAASSYHIFFNHFKPVIFLGLTATPERMDGDNILKYYDGRFAAEIRLPEAIERKLLSPFQYFGVTDIIDFSTLRWVRGGYDHRELSNLLTITQGVAIRRAEHIAQAVSKYVTDINEVKGLGFCVSVEHAKFMADRFNQLQIPSISITGDTPNDERFSAKKLLSEGGIRFIFTVDIYNEGVDIPEINTVLFLRPTESLTIFLQQLGRGLRLADNKECLTVLDFIGQAHRKYNFEEKFIALLANSNRNVVREVQGQFANLPKGCYIQLERVAKNYILDNIRRSINQRSGLVARLVTFVEDTQLPLTLTNFLDHYRLDPRVIYKTSASFSRLCVDAGVKDDFREPGEAALTGSLQRLSLINSRRLIQFLLDILPQFEPMLIQQLLPLETTLFQMFYITVWNKAIENWSVPEVDANLQNLTDSPSLRSEICELLEHNYNRIDFVDEPLNFGFACPIDLHCQYSMRQIMGALDYYNFGAMQGLGVKYLPEKNVDLFFITLNKSENEYSPTTMYNDYSISDYLFHWQSQSTTSAHSQTGQRYINHQNRGSKVLLFVREYKKDLFGTAPYTCLGFADYVEHQGNAPMNIIWRLHNPIPAKYLRMTNKLIV